MECGDMRVLISSVACVCSVLAISAQAHVVFDVNQVPAGQLSLGALRVSHGCNGSPTTRIEVTLPDGVTRVVPRALSGWTISTQTRKLAAPITLHGQQVSEVTSKIIWSGGGLPDNLYEQFEFRYQAPMTAGRVLYFPVEQTCANGATSWSNIPRTGQRWEELATPAPFITIMPSPSGNGHRH
jgi:periplasmic copper chaperone A